MDSTAVLTKIKIQKHNNIYVVIKGNHVLLKRNSNNATYESLTDPESAKICQILNIESNFTPEVVLWPFLCMRTRSGQNGSKRGQIGKNSGSVQNQAQRT